MHIVVIEPPGGPVRAALARQTGRPVLSPDGRCDIAVWADPGARLSRPLAARALVVSGTGAGLALRYCRAGAVVTYGFSPRDTLTPSSMLDGRYILSLQRAVVSLNGAITLPGELRIGPTNDLETAMAAAAVGLLLRTTAAE